MNRYVKVGGDKSAETRIELKADNIELVLYIPGHAFVDKLFPTGKLPTEVPDYRTVHVLSRLFIHDGLSNPMRMLLQEIYREVLAESRGTMKPKVKITLQKVKR